MTHTLVMPAEHSWQKPGTGMPRLELLLLVQCKRKHHLGPPQAISRERPRVPGIRGRDLLEGC